MRGKQFGELLRALRQKSGRSCGELARHLDVSVPYLSRVERGGEPLTARRIEDAASFLKLDDDDALGLVRAAGAARGFFKLEVLTEAHSRAGAALVRAWAHLGEAELEKIEDAFSGSDPVDDLRRWWAR